MPYILILLFSVQNAVAPLSVTTAEFADLAACNAAYSTAARLMLRVGERYSVVAECVPKSSAPAAKGK